MRNETRALFKNYVADIASANMIDPGDVESKFSVTPAVQQRLESKIQLSSSFLSQINIVGVDNQQGEKIGIGVTGPNASTTDTTQKDREPSNLLSLDKNGYSCTQTNFDTYLTYAQLDAWRHFDDFEERVRKAIMQRQALDRIMIGWNGKSRAATSNRTSNPLLQDVNKGWIQHLREKAPERVMSDAGSPDNKINVGATGDYKNLDALAFDLKNNMIAEWYREDPRLVVICGSALLADKYFPIVNTANPPTEQVALDVVLSSKRIGAMPAITVPFFPAKSMAITRLDNLSIYFQLGARRRTIVDNAKRDRVENYESSNDAYVVEDFDCFAYAENITLV